MANGFITNVFRNIFRFETKYSDNSQIFLAWKTSILSPKRADLGSFSGYTNAIQGEVFFGPVLPTKKRVFGLHERGPKSPRTYYDFEINLPTEKNGEKWKTLMHKNPNIRYDKLNYILYKSYLIASKELITFISAQYLHMESSRISIKYSTLKIGRASRREISRRKN